MRRPPARKRTRPKLGPTGGPGVAVGGGFAEHRPGAPSERCTRPRLRLKSRPHLFSAFFDDQRAVARRRRCGRAGRSAAAARSRRTCPGIPCCRARRAASRGGRSCPGCRGSPTTAFRWSGPGRGRSRRRRKPVSRPPVARIWRRRCPWRRADDERRALRPRDHGRELPGRLPAPSRFEHAFDGSLDRVEPARRRRRGRRRSRRRRATRRRSVVRSAAQGEDRRARRLAARRRIRRSRRSRSAEPLPALARARGRRRRSRRRRRALLRRDGPSRPPCRIAEARDERPRRQRRRRPGRPALGDRPGSMEGRIDGCRRVEAGDPAETAVAGGDHDLAVGLHGDRPARPVRRAGVGRAAPIRPRRRLPGASAAPKTGCVEDTVGEDPGDVEVGAGADAGQALVA